MQSQATSTDPTTGSVIFQTKLHTKEEVEQKLKNSFTAYQMYRKSDPKSRTDRLNRLADVLEKNMDKLSRMITMEMGKPMKQSKKEVTKSVELIRYYASNMNQFVKNEDLKTNAKKSYIVFQPLGPIYQMTAYNFPLFNIMRRAIPVLVMGNTVLNRSSETTPQTAMMVEEMFMEAGMASGEYINLMTTCEQSEMIISCPNVRGVSFIGSMEAGTKVASLAGKYGKKIMMDLGGSDAFIVMKDADMNMAVEEAVISRLKNAGQATISAKRFMIEDSVYEDFKVRLLQRVMTVKIGNPMDESTELGPLANKEGLQKAMEEIKRAQDQGAKMLYGGEQPKDPNLQKGYYLMPTVMEVPEGNLLLKEDIFAPIFVLTRFRTDGDVIRMVNDSPMGVSTSIFTKDEGRAQTIGYELEVGSVFMNTMWIFSPAMPVGGVKASGFGREGGVYGTREFVNMKTIYIA